MLLYPLINFFGNLAALALADRLIDGFETASRLRDLLLAAAALTVLHIAVRPILRLLFSPLVIITFGLMLIVINAALLFVLDIFAEGITISGFLALLSGTVVISAVNFVTHLIYKVAKIIV